MMNVDNLFYQDYQRQVWNVCYRVLGYINLSYYWRIVELFDIYFGVKADDRSQLMFVNYSSKYMPM